MTLLLAGTFMAVLDFFIVNIAIPDIQQDLAATSAEVQFIVAGFAVANGSFLIIGSRLGDAFGRKRMYVLGLGLFTCASAVCGVASSATVLVAARVVQGLAAALLSPQALAIFASVLKGEAKARAFNDYGVAMGIASVFAQVIGGLLIHFDLFGWGWRSCFLINVPIGAVGVILSARMIPESYAPRRPHLDLAGMALIALTLTAVVLPLIQGREQGWPAWSWLCLASAAPLLALFTAWEWRFKRCGGSPLIDLELFQERTFAVGLLAQVCFYMSMAAFYLVFALFLQQGRGLDPLSAGFVFVANGVGYLVTSKFAGNVVAVLGCQVIALAGLLRVAGLGLLLLAVATIGIGGPVGWLVPGLVLNGAGTGFAVAPLTTTILSRLAPRHVGAASGVLTTGLQVGNAIGVALIGAIFYGTLSAGIPESYAPAFVFSLGYLIGMNLVVVGLVQFVTGSRQQPHAGDARGDARRDAKTCEIP